jgi:DNA-cytosine methyltransferase
MDRSQTHQQDLETGNDNVDTTEITHISLCSGYGGIDLGLKRVCQSLRTVAYSEIEAYACEVLLARMESGALDAAPIWSDLKSFPWAEFSGKVDILSGGYPCQPFSSAGKRIGKDDPRHLWPWIADGIAVMRPRICFFENVEGHITLGLSTVISDLEEMDYEVSWGIFSAAECGAPHQRKRVFIMANCRNEGLQRCRGFEQIRLQEGWETSEGHTAASSELEQPRILWPSRPGQLQYQWEPPRTTESTMGGISDGSANRMDNAKLSITCDSRVDEIRLLGNGVVPACAELAFKTLLKNTLNEKRNNDSESGDVCTADHR